MPHTSQHKSKKRALDSQSEEDCLIEQALSFMKNDEFDIFGQFVANELRQMANPSLRNAIKHQIMRDLMSAPYQHSNSSSNSANDMQQYSIQNVPYSANNITFDASCLNDVTAPVSANNTTLLESTQTHSEPTHSNAHQIVYDDIIVYSDL